MSGKRILTLAAVGILALSGTGYALYQDQQAERRPLPTPLSLPSSSSPASETSSIPPQVLGETASQETGTSSETVLTSLPSTESPLLRLRWQENAREQLANGGFVIKPDGVLALARRAVTAGILGRHVIEADDIDSNSITSRTIRNKTVASDDLADTLSLGDVTVRKGLTVEGDATLAGNLDVAGMISGSFAGAFAPSGDVDMTTHILTNIGDNGTDFTTTGGLTLADTLSLPSLTAARLLATDGSSQVIASSLSNWLSGTADQITVTDDGDGTSTLSLPQSIATDSSPIFAGITLTGLTSGYFPFINASGQLSTNGPLFWDTSNNRFGIGTTSPQTPFDVQATLTGINGSTFGGSSLKVVGSNISVTMQQSVLPPLSTNVYGQRVVAQIPSTSSQSFGNNNTLVGSDTWAWQAGSGSVTELLGSQAVAYHTGSGATVNMWGMEAAPYVTAGSISNISSFFSRRIVTGGTVTNMIGLRLFPVEIYGGTVTNTYGIYMDSAAFGSGTNNWGIFQANNYQNYFGGNVGIGTTSPGTKLAVSGLTGTSSYNLVRVDTATGDFYYDSSSARYKDDIHPFEEDFSKILDLTVKEYTDKTSRQSEIGLIAEELDAAGLNHLVIYKDGVPDAIKYDRIPMYLLGVLQAQGRRIADLETDGNAALASSDTLDALTARMDTLETTSAALTDFYTALSLDTLLMKAADGNLDLGDGTLLAKKVDAQEIATDSITVRDREDSPTLGTAEIKAGETEVTVETAAVTKQSRIFVTPEVALGEAPAVTGRKDGKSFTVEVLNAPEKDLPFSWWIVESGTGMVPAPVTP